MTILFSGKLICQYCKKRMRGKLARKKRIYVCSSWSNYGKDACIQNKVEQDLLVECLSLRYGKILSKEDVELLVEKIIVTEEEIRIKLYEGDDIILNEKFGSF